MRLLLPVLLLSLAACTGDDTDTESDTDVVDTNDTDDTDTDVPDDDFIVECAVERVVPSEGMCDVTSVGNGSVVAITGTVLGAEDAYVDGIVLYDGDTISCTGCDCEIPADATVVSCGDNVVSPGLIDPHDHLTFTEGAPIDVGERRWDHRHGWRGTLSTPSNSNGTGADGDGTRWGEVRKLVGGTTTLVGSGWARGLIRNLDRNDGSMDSRLPWINNDTFPLGDSNERFQSDCGWNYAFDDYEVAGHDGYVPHVAEGINTYAAEEAYCLSSEFDGGMDAMEPNAAWIHAIGLQTVEYDHMVREGTALIWSPRSNLQLYGETARVTTFATLGGTIALGSDWTYSGSIHPGRELACADHFNQTNLSGFFTDRDLWRMSTRNAAMALQAGDLIGTLDAGMLADIAVFAAPEDPESPWRAPIEAGAGEVGLVVRGGVALYGEADLLEALGEGCEAVEVCGNAHAMCLDVDTTFASLSNTMRSDYPAWFCDGPPEDEPLCSAWRPDDWPGEPVEGDDDGDGITNDVDLCPDIFDPIRPIDDGLQHDLDEDGLGDACDPEPLPADLDGDGEVNDVDNCPYLANADQADADEDGKGDACDFCPTVANVGPCPPEVASITGIRTGEIAVGTSVLLEGVTVNGVWGSGIYVQDTRVGPENSGLAIFVNGSAGVDVGDTVDIAGTVGDYFGELQLADVVVTDRGAGTAPTPVVLTVEQAATEAYEGVLVTINGSVSDLDYDCAVDGSCSDTGLWEVGGGEGIVVYDRCYEGAGWDGLKGTLPVTGVMTTRWNRRRIMPRFDSDFGG